MSDSNDQTTVSTPSSEEKGGEEEVQTLSQVLTLGLLSSTKVPRENTVKLKLKPKEIQAEVKGSKRCGDGTYVLVGTQKSIEEGNDSRSWDVIPGSEKTLKCSGRKLKDVKAVLVITATCTLDPPNFRAMIAEDKMDVGKTFGSKKGLIVKHFLHARYGKKDIGGGCYFFESEADIEAYLSSEFWAKVAVETPWKDIQYEMYAVESESAFGAMCCRRLCS